MMNEYSPANKTSETSTAREAVSLLLPTAGILKINTDAAYCAMTNIAKLGTVIRDSVGNVLFCAAARRFEVFSPLQAKLMAISFGLDTARDNGLLVIQVEPDSLLAVQESEKGFSSSCEWGSIVCDICLSLKSCVLGSVCYVRREANYFALNLANLNVEGANDVLWWEALPLSFCNPDLS